MAHRQITNIQRYELLEERLGISISSVGAWLEDIDDEFYLRLTWEIIALNGGALEHDIAITISVLDENGVGLQVRSNLALKKPFFGIDAYGETILLPSSNIGLIKMIPTKYGS